MENHFKCTTKSYGNRDEGLFSTRKEKFLDTDVLELPPGGTQDNYNTKSGTPPIMEKHKESFNILPLDNGTAPCSITNTRKEEKEGTTIVTDELQEFQDTLAEIDRLEAAFDEKHFIENVDKHYDLLINSEPEILNGFDEERLTHKVMPLICQVE